MRDLEIPFGFSTTADDILNDVDLRGKRAFVTGGASGIGIETAKSLAKAGAEVVIGARDFSDGERVVQKLKKETGNESISFRQLDLTDWKTIDAIVEGWEGPLDILVNNAGVMALQVLQYDTRGHELHFATNYLGHFKLTIGLHNALQTAGNARVVIVSSSGHLFSPVVFDDIDYNFRLYDPLSAYAQSKTACNLFAAGAAKRWLKDGITINSLNPGAIATNLQRHIGGKLQTPKNQQKSPEQGAATSVLLAASPYMKKISGCYFNDCQLADIVQKRPSDISILAGKVAIYSLEESNADLLWKIGLEAIKGPA